jgi:hypothetical protein
VEFLAYSPTDCVPSDFFSEGSSITVRCSGLGPDPGPAFPESTGFCIQLFNDSGCTELAQDDPECFFSYGQPLCTAADTYLQLDLQANTTLVVKSFEGDACNGLCRGIVVLPRPRDN